VQGAEGMKATFIEAPGPPDPIQYGDISPHGKMIGLNRCGLRPYPAGITA